MSSKIVLKYSLIFVISSVIVLGSENTNNGRSGNNKVVENLMSSSSPNISSVKSESDKNHSTTQFASEAGVIEDIHSGGVKSRKRPILKFVNESESTETKINATKDIAPLATIVKTENKTSTTPTIDSSDHQKPIKETHTVPTKLTPTQSTAKVIVSTTTAKKSSISTSTSTTTTTRSSTTTTTTPKPIPKKPVIALNAADNPGLVDLEKKVHIMPPVAIKENLIVEEPIAELSQERTVEELSNNRYILYITLVFALPTFVGLLAIGYRRFKDHWQTRQYRRVDFLVDGMYTD